MANIYRVKDLPADERPREKAIQFGVETLSNSELIAILLGTGGSGRNAIELGRHLLKKHDHLFALSKTHWRMLAHEPGIGTAKAIRLSATFELARRLNSLSTPEKHKFNAPEVIFNAYRHRLASLDQEVLFVLVLNTKNELLALEEVSRGVVNSAIAHPREIYHAAIRHLGTGIILMHNHPSQSTAPSQADRELTKIVSDAGRLLNIPLVDHVIIALNGYFSFKEEGLL